MKGLREILSYSESLLLALNRRFGDDFKDPFIKEIKDVLDFNYMIGLEEAMNANEETYAGCVAKIEKQGNESLRKIVKRQNCESPPNEAEITKIEKQFVTFKKFAFDLMVGVDMTKERKSIISAAVDETAVCLECHRRFQMSAMLKHVNSDHKELDSVRCQDKIKNFNSIKVLHGVCQQEKYFLDIQDFISVSLKLLCKTPNEAIVESMGSMLIKHMKPERPAGQISFESELNIDWNGPVVARADSLLARSLDRKFGSRKRWNFKTGSSKFYTSQVVDRKKGESSRLSFLNK